LLLVIGLVPPQRVRDVFDALAGEDSLRPDR
jgi:hypothetical protein